MLMKKSFCQDLAVLELERNLMEDWRTKVQEDLLGGEGGGAGNSKLIGGGRR